MPLKTPLTHIMLPEEWLTLRLSSLKGQSDAYWCCHSARIRWFILLDSFELTGWKELFKYKGGVKMFEPDACYSKTNQDHTFLLRLLLVRASSMSYLCHPPPLRKKNRVTMEKRVWQPLTFPQHPMIKVPSPCKRIMVHMDSCCWAGVVGRE